MDLLRSLPVRSSDQEEPLSTLKQKRTIYIDDDEDEETRMPLKKAKYDLGLDIQDVSFEIPRVGRSYLEDQAERHRELSRNKDYRFANELAGALRKNLSDIIEPSEMRRLEQRQLQQKSIGIDRESIRNNIEKLRDQARELKRNVEIRQDLRVPDNVQRLSTYLVDNETLPLTTNNSYYGFLGLASLYNAYGAGGDEAQRVERHRLADDELSSDVRDQTDAWLDLFSYMHLYYRDFLNNESDYSLRDAITERLTYLLDTVVKSSVKKEEGVAKDYEAELGARGVSADANPLRRLREFYEEEANVQDVVDWSLYKRRQTETINMIYFDALEISRPLEAEMARRGVLSRYGEDHPVYVEKVLDYLYGSPEVSVNATKGANGLDLLSADTNRGGNPPDIDALIRIQFPDYATERAPLDAIKRLVRSHLLWLFFDEPNWKEKIDLLMSEQESIIINIRRITNAFIPILGVSVSLYKTFLLDYLKRVASLLRAPPPVIRLTPEQETLLSPSNANGSDDPKNFDKLNFLFRNVELADLVQDKSFYEYLTTKGTQIFDQQYPVLVLHTLLRLYQEYIQDYANASTNNLAQINNAIQKLLDQLNAPTVQQQQPTINGSDHVEMNSEMNHLLRKAYHYVNDYAEALRGLPLEAYQTDNAYEIGLSTDFITFVAVLAADLELMFPDGYRSQKYYTKLKQEKQAIMARLRRYTWEGGKCGRPYIIKKDVCMTPCFAMPRQFPLYSCGGGRIMF